jgi:hypothetical protein
MRAIFFLLLALTSFAYGASGPSLCDFLNVPGCSGVTKQARRLSSVSMPSPSTAANINPAAVSFDRGVGFEVMAQNHNPLNFSFASGTGRVGGALISANMENAFFGNRIPEVDGAYLKRYEEDKQYKARKFSAALGTRLIKHKHFNVDIGLILKRHSEIKRINPGLGSALRYRMFNIGFSFYQDDMFLDYRRLIDPSSQLPYEYIRNEESMTYQERFNVESYTAGMRLGNLSVDAGIIKTKYKVYDYLKEDTSKIFLYSAAYNYKNILLNIGIRNEFTPGVKYIDNNLEDRRHMRETFLGLQVSFNKHVIAGINYNYFLLRELSLATTLFF